MAKYTADFETATWQEDETWVWAFAICEINNPDNIVYGNSIDDFFEWCKKSKNAEVYFHNLKFDGEFILSYLLNNGYKYIKDTKDRENETFSTLITDMGQFFSITVYFSVGNKKVKKVTFYDSLKILPFSVDKIAKSFGLPISKLSIDYLEEREKGHILTPEEIEYIKNDVKIVALALKTLFDEKLTKMTQASNALYDYKNIIHQDRFEHFFPKLDYEIDKDIRKSYKGGFTYLNPIYKEKDVGTGIVLDVNSLYPSVMYEKKLPICQPVFYEGKYKEDKIYDLFIQRITCSFELKENMIPTIQIKGSMSFMPNEYLESSKGEIVALTLTNIDLKLFLEHYNVYDLKYECGWKFRSINGLFCKYIDKWSARKIEAKKDGNGGMYTLSKLMLNSLYGKFALNPDSQTKFPFMGDDGIVHYSLNEKELRNPIYIPVGTFITSYAREKTIRTSQSIKEYSLKNFGKDMYIYSDTDSIHTLLPISECKKFCEIDDYKLGFWKHESTFEKARFIRQKCYVEVFDGDLNITCAGMPKSCYEFVNYDNFKTGFTCGGKLTFKHIKGGVKLIDTEFTIKEEKIKKSVEKIK